MPRNKVSEKAFPVGLFILLSLIMLIGGVLWLRNFAVKPSYEFIVKYRDPSRVAAGTPVYFRGVQVGRVTKVELAPDLQSTYTYVGIQRRDFPLPENIRVHIRVEGITGQRFLDIEPPPPELVIGRISDGEMVRGVETFTLDKLQEQLNRIAEERTLEKLVISSQEAMSELAVASREWQVFTRQAQHVVQRAEPHTLEAIDEFSRAARQVGLAANDFSGLSGETKGQLSSALPKITSALEQFSQSTQGANLAFSAVQEAANQVGVTFGTVNTQLVQTNLIPSLSQTITDIGGSLRSVGQAFQTTQPAITELQGVLSSVGQTGQTLHQNLGRVQLEREEAQRLASSLQALQQLGAQIQQTVNTVQPGLTQPQNPQELQKQLDRLETLSNEITVTVNRVTPDLVQAQQATITGNQQAGSSIQAIVTAIQDLGRLGQTVSLMVKRIEPTLTREVALPPQGTVSISAGQQPSLITSLQNTIKEVGQAARRIDCVSAQLSHILEQRFLGFKLFFGKPGGGYECDVLSDRTHIQAKQCSPGQLCQQQAVFHQPPNP